MVILPQKDKSVPLKKLLVFDTCRNIFIFWNNHPFTRGTTECKAFSKVSGNRWPSAGINNTAAQRKGVWSETIDSGQIDDLMARKSPIREPLGWGEAEPSNSADAAPSATAEAPSDDDQPAERKTETNTDDLAERPDGG